MNKIVDYLNELIPNPKCELNYTKDYELLLATMLSAQTTDKRVNMVTSILFKKYNSLAKLREAKVEDITEIIRPVGTFNKKANNIIEIAKRLETVGDIVPNNREFLESLPQYFNSVVLGIVVVIVITGILIFFLNTDFGQAFIATGDNPSMAKSLGIYTDFMVIVGLMLSNGIVALCGALIAQNNGYADINMGIGTIVIALASIIIGEVAFGELTLNQRLVAVTLGSIIYRLILLAVLQLGFSANDLNLISSIVLALCMMLPQLEKFLHLKKPVERGVKKHD